MIRTVRWVGLLAAALASSGSLLLAQSSASRASALADIDVAEERYQRLNSAVEGLLAAQANTQRRLDALAAEIARLSGEASRSGAGTVTREELNSVIATIREIDRKREADKQQILKEIAGLEKSLLDSMRATPRPPPRDPPPSAATKPAYDEFVEHSIDSGETLHAIVRAYNEAYQKKGRKTSLDRVLEANPKLKPTAIPVGQKIVIPLVPN